MSGNVNGESPGNYKDLPPPPCSSVYLKIKLSRSSVYLKIKKKSEREHPERLSNIQR